MILITSLLLPALILSSARAWTIPTANTASRLTTPGTDSVLLKTTKLVKATTTRLYNIPPPAEEDVKEFVEYASKQSPPASFFDLQQDCIRSIRLARNNGCRLLEVEFPPLPANVMEMDDVSSYDVARANLKLAIDFSKGLLTATADQSDEKAVKQIAILFPDMGETNIAIEKFMNGNKVPAPGIVVESLRRENENDDRIFQPEQLLLGLFGRDSGGAVKPVNGTDVYICLTFSAQELPDLEELHGLQPDATIIFYNLKLDTLRGDLGAPAFPPKAFQDRFLSKVKPAYYLRTRQYSRSTSRPPFIVNFQGCLFRAYPGEYQTLLDTGVGRYRRVCSSPIRPALGEFKQNLIDELTKVGVLEEEKGSMLNFLRTGYKVTTWWEDERTEASNDWKS